MSYQIFYQNRAQDYFERTFSIDPSSFLLPLTHYLEPGSTVLDVACGSGRDMLWLHSKGYACTGLEGSPALAALARSHTSLPVIEADFKTYDFASCQVDALLLIAALVHEPHARFGAVLSRIMDALKPRGLVMISMKQGRGIKTFADGRTFYLWEKNPLIQIFKNNDLTCVEDSVQVSKLRESDIWMSFLLRKQS